jgi:hypothetical protein
MDCNPKDLERIIGYAISRHDYDHRGIKYSIFLGLREFVAEPGLIGDEARAYIHEQVTAYLTARGGPIEDDTLDSEDDKNESESDWEEPEDEIDLDDGLYISNC